MNKMVHVAGYPRHEIPERVSELIGQEYHTTEFMYDGGFVAHLCYTGPEMDTYSAYNVTMQDGFYEAVMGNDDLLIDIAEGIHEHIYEEPIHLGDYDMVASIYGYEEEGTDRYET